MASNIKFSIVTVSDTCYSDSSKDKSGPTLANLAQEYYPDCQIKSSKIVPDFQPLIESTLIELCTRSNNPVDVIMLTGGTGFAPRDVTPEAVKNVITKECPGLAYAMIAKSLEKTEMAMLSRMVCGIRNHSIIVSLPGSPKACKECFEVIREPLKHAVSLMRSSYEEAKEMHSKLHETKMFEASKVFVKVAQRNRSSPYAMLEVLDAQKLVLDNCEKFKEFMFNSSPQKSKEQNIVVKNLSVELLNYILAEDIITKEAVPTFAASLKDGYAVLTVDGVGVRRVKNAIIAGDQLTNEPLKNGECVRISTGAPIPLGADAVVQVEDTKLVSSLEDGSLELEIEILKKPSLNQDIKGVGVDVPKDIKILNKGTKISYAHLGVMASIGYSKVKVFQKPKICVVSTGNELQSFHEQLNSFSIRDSNKIALLALLKHYGFDGCDGGIARDTPDDVKRCLWNAFLNNDVVISSGGVSMGEFDVIKKVIEVDFGGTVHFGRVNMKPGKPTTFATLTFEGKQKLFFGLPGNPVSALVTSVLFVLPALKSLVYDDKNNLPMVKARLDDFQGNLDIRPEYLRVSLKQTNENNMYIAHSTGDQISSRLNSFIGAHGLLCLPGKNDPKAAKITKDTLFDVILLEHP